MECRPFSFVVILEGLQYSVQGAEDGSLSYAMLTLHVEEVLAWFWSHDGGTYLQEYAAKDPPDTLLGMVIFRRAIFYTLEDVYHCVTDY